MVIPMRENIATIPLIDAFKADDECPFCNLERKAVIKTGEDQAKGLGGAAGQLASALVGQVAQAIDGLVDEFEGLGAQLFGVVERVGNRAQRNPGLARDVADFYLCHSGPFDAFQVQARL